MNKSSKRRRAQEQKRTRKAASILRSVGQSKYAIKHEEQRKGKFRRTSPFYAASTTVPLSVG